MVPPVTDDEQNLSIRTAEEGGRTVLLVAGELDPHTAEELSAALEPLVSVSGPDEVVLDLSGIEFMDSSGLRAVLAANDAVRSRGGRLVLSKPSDSVRRLLEITDLLTLLDVES
jgi:anti-anti-sigma factor